MYHIATTLSEAMNFSMVFKPYGSYGSQLANGSWTGAIRAVAEGEADMSINDFSIMKERSKVVDFGVGMFEQSAVLFLLKPVQSVRYAANIPFRV